MSRHLPAQRPAPRVIHYPDVAARPSASVLARQYSAAELMVAAAQAVAQQRTTDMERREQYAAWLLRREEIARRDRRVRTALLLGVPAGLVVLAGLGWLLFSTTAAALAGLGPVVIGGVVVAGGVGVVAGGRRCITVVQHWHE